MAKQEQDKQSTGPGGDNLNAISSQYRQLTGLPERTSDEPITNGEEPSRLRVVDGPEGGYGNEGPAEDQGTSESETAADAEGRELTGGETATEVARVTGEDVPDVKPAPGTVAEDTVEEKPAEKKAPAKKTGGK